VIWAVVNDAIADVESADICPVVRAEICAVESAEACVDLKAATPDVVRAMI
jgi:hypothetical protein